MCMFELKSDMCVIAHDYILLKYLSDHELWRQLQAARIQPVSSRRLSCSEHHDAGAHTHTHTHTHPPTHTHTCKAQHIVNMSRHQNEFSDRSAVPGKRCETTSAQS